MRGSTATALLFTVPLLACSGPDHNPVEPDGLPEAMTSAAPPAPATTLPAPPSPDPPLTQKPISRPPTVALRFVGNSGCHPRRVGDRVEPCTVDVRAVASDPDGDPLSYSWKGCTTGSGRTSSCTIDSPGTFTAAVDVSDGRGGTARDSLSVSGINRPPSAILNPHQPPFRVGQHVEIYGVVQDPDDGLVCGRQWCVRAEATGACGPSAFLDCPCLGDLYAEVRAHSVGTCTVTVTLKDDWPETA